MRKLLHVPGQLTRYAPVLREAEAGDEAEAEEEDEAEVEDEAHGVDEDDMQHAGATEADEVHHTSLRTRETVPGETILSHLLSPTPHVGKNKIEVN